MKILAMEWLKTKRTPLRLIAWVTPLLASPALLWYVGQRTVTAETPFWIYQVVFQCWGAVVVPVGASLLPGLLAYEEETSGHFFGLLQSRIPRKKLYLGKLGMAFILAMASTLLFIGLFLGGMALWLNVPIPWLAYLVGTMVLLVATLPLLALYLWVSFAWGLGAALGLGGCGLLLAALMVTGLGEGVWFLIPWAWPPRLAGLVGFWLSPLGGSLPTGFILTEISKGLFPALGVFLGLTNFGTRWFARWEGRAMYE
jgi:lantibiotic protection ABC transporter MutG family permease subunit